MALIAIYAGSSVPDKDNRIATTAHGLGQSLAAYGHGIIFGGSAKGVMGEVARGALYTGGRVFAALPPALLGKEPRVEGVTYLECLTMAGRLAHFRAADAHIALDGGTGTAEEIFHIVNAMCFGRWGINTEVAIRPCPLGLVAHYSLQDLYQFLQKGAEDGRIDAPVFNEWIKYGDPVEILAWLADKLSQPPAA